MPFDQITIGARLTLGSIWPEEMPSVAWDALEAGYDGPAIRRMAAFVNPTGFEVDAVLPAFKREAHIPQLSKSESAVRMAYNIAREIVDMRKDPIPYADTFNTLWIAADYSREIQQLGTWRDDIYLSLTYFGGNKDDVQQELRDQLILFIRGYEASLASNE